MLLYCVIENRAYLMPFLALLLNQQLISDYNRYLLADCAFPLGNDAHIRSSALVSRQSAVQNIECRVVKKQDRNCYISCNAHD
jgi:hypothetical protein